MLPFPPLASLLPNGPLAVCRRSTGSIHGGWMSRTLGSLLSDDGWRLGRLRGWMVDCAGRVVVAMLLSVWLVGISLASLGQAAEDDESVAFFEQRIRPMLIDHCYDCHGPYEAAAKLRLDLKSGWQRGGERGPAIVPGNPAASLLIRAVSYKHAELKMPPGGESERLSDQQIADLITWVRQGAHDPRDGEEVLTEIDQAAEDHWAFQPVSPPSIDEGCNPIDVLVERKLKQRGFVATEPADMRTLVRRVVYDLHGLPPNAEQLATTREGYPELIRRLLASPRYGERWGRHWLDVARYSDAKDGVLMYGDDRIRPFAYTYRDYVIRAFNEDKPFDQFIREQLAADHLQLPESPSAEPSELAALGLLTLGRMFDNNRHDVIDDQIDVVTRGFLGLTVTCARCHDHKFDPIPTADYYSLYGVFASSIEPLDRPRIESVSEAGEAFEAEFSTKLSEVNEQRRTHYASTLQTARERTADYLVAVATTEPDVAETTIFFLSLTPDQLRPQITRRWRQLITRRAFPDDPIFGPWYDLMHTGQLAPEAWRKRVVDQRVIDALVNADPQSPTAVARAYGELIHAEWSKAYAKDDVPRQVNPEGDPLVTLLASHDSPVWFPEEDIGYYLSRQPNDAFRSLVGQLDAITVKHPDAAARAMVVTDSEVLCDPVIFQRGDPTMRGTPVPRQFLKVLSPDQRTPFTRGSGRLELAGAIASPDNPLTARVWVNRVWMHHFGQPLVETPSDFGLQAERPEHLELLDFLADFLVRHGWRTKPLHERILTSRTYQRASRIPSTPEMSSQLVEDPSNTLLWHGNRRRLDLEQMRDTLLQVSGQLDTRMFGRPRTITDPQNHRRTVYAFVERQNIPDMVSTFDFANADTSTARRTITTVPQQALFAMNSTFMMTAASELAKRVRECECECDEPIAELYQRAYGRPPSTDEIATSRQFLEANSEEALAQVLLMSNELMFVD